MKTKIHAAAGSIAFLCVLSFWTSSVTVEVFGSHAAIAMVKQMIVYALIVMVPAMAIVGATGMSLGAKRKGALIEAKKKRMPIIAGAGLLVLVPAALYLNYKASNGAFDTMFYVVQGIELVAGAMNLSLLGLNIRDGLKMTAKRRQMKARA
ncbi:hypothetical protein ALP8811_02315 [Aliiroseovarius pelagivivens]|uniref:Uncharacterized protein n=1 Tax=Aliiroseovarius pelagivivens TaxID=1639690 RepID=A0A2R8AMQ7_9RHOB|nr:hypothetical protein [Aliiroseovarius pelagivivens]SPF77290.1 hypothetical protein ALP8811_02315 [Aliiroseovarius pelagivivens]